jgi:hypothetical protein
MIITSSCDSVYGGGKLATAKAPAAKKAEPKKDDKKAKKGGCKTKK